jgi:hypothetical protein
VQQQSSINVAEDMTEAAMCMDAAFSTDGKRLAVSTSARKVVQPMHTGMYHQCTATSRISRVHST